MPSFQFHSQRLPFRGAALSVVSTNRFQNESMENRHLAAVAPFLLSSAATFVSPAATFVLPPKLAPAVPRQSGEEERDFPFSPSRVSMCSVFVEVVRSSSGKRMLAPNASFFGKERGGGVTFAN